jgi:hypothetical protein
VVDQYSELTEAEMGLRAAFLAGEAYDLQSEDPLQNDSSNPNVDWDSSRTIRAGVVAKLLLDQSIGPGEAAARFRLSGARISGTLDLGCGHVHLFMFTNCRFDAPPLLNDATAPFAAFIACLLPGLSAARFDAGRALWLDDSLVTASLQMQNLTAGEVRLRRTRMTVGGGVRGELYLCGADIAHSVIAPRVFLKGARFCMNDARIGGSFEISGGHIHNPKSDALRAATVEVGGSVYATGGFHSTGTFDIEGAKVGGAVYLNNAKLRSGGQAPALVADHAEIALGLRASGIEIAGLARVHHAKIGCQLSFRNASLRNPDGYALKADHLQVDGAFLLNGKFVAEGSIDMHGAQVFCNIDLSGAVINKVKDENSALYMRGVDIVGDIFARDLVIDGHVNLNVAKVTGNLGFSGARFTRPGRVGLQLGNSSIGGSLNLSGGFICTGGIAMTDLTIGASLDIRAAKLHHKDSIALNARRLRLGGDLLGSEVEVEGLLDLAGSQVGGDVRLTDAELHGVEAKSATFGQPISAQGENARGVSLRLTGASVGGALDLSGSKVVEDIVLRAAQVDRRVSLDNNRSDSAEGLVIDASVLRAESLSLRFNSQVGEINLAGAQIDTLLDEARSWPESGRVVLEGLRYGYLKSTMTVEDRLCWLNSAGDATRFSPQPYEQLALWYESVGEGASARKVRLAALRTRDRSGAIGHKLWCWVQDFFVGYGYIPSRALLIFLVLWVGGSIWFTFGVGSCSAPGQSGIGLCAVKPDEHPTWDPWLYSLDALVPLVSLGHDAAWDVTGWSKFVTYVLTFSGWVLVTSIVAGAGRVLKRS